MQKLSLVTASQLLPVSVDEIKRHSRVVVDEQDEIQEQIKDAVGIIEDYTHRSLLTTKWIGYLNSFPTGSSGQFPFVKTKKAEIQLAKGYVQAVTKLSYINQDGDEIELEEGEDFEVDLYAKPAIITPLDGRSFPIAKRTVNAVKVEFTAGWPSPDKLPRPIKRACKLLVGGMYENREYATPGVAMIELPGIMNVYKILDPLVVPEVAPCVQDA